MGVIITRRCSERIRRGRGRGCDPCCRDIGSCGVLGVISCGQGRPFGIEGVVQDGGFVGLTPQIFSLAARMLRIAPILLTWTREEGATLTASLTSTIRGGWVVIRTEAIAVPGNARDPRAGITIEGRGTVLVGLIRDEIPRVGEGNGRR